MKFRRIENLGVVLVSLFLTGCLLGQTIEYRLPAGYEGYFAVVPGISDAQKLESNGNVLSVSIPETGFAAVQNYSEFFQPVHECVKRGSETVGNSPMLDRPQLEILRKQGKVAFHGLGAANGGVKLGNGKVLSTLWYYVGLKEHQSVWDTSNDTALWTRRPSAVADLIPSLVALAYKHESIDQNAKALLVFEDVRKRIKDKPQPDASDLLRSDVEINYFLDVLGKPDEAVKYLEEASRLAKTIVIPSDYADHEGKIESLAYQYIAKGCIQRKALEPADELITRMMAMDDTRHFCQGTTVVLLVHCIDAYRRKKEWNKALKLAEKGIQYTKDFSDRNVYKKAAINAWQRVVQSKPKPNS